MDKSVGEIAELVGGTVVGDAAVRLTGASAITHARTGDVTFVNSRQYLSMLAATDAAAALVDDSVPAGSIPLIRVKNPYMAFIRVIRECLGWREPRHPTGIHPSAVVGKNVCLGEGVGIDAHVRIADDCTIGDRAVLYAGVYIGQGSIVGNDTVIYPNAVIREGTRVGARCVLHAGVSIGSDGFGFVPSGDRLTKIPQMGDVVIGDDVEIGANSAVDRATFASTVIGKGTKIDNLVQIGHNVEIGEHCVICGMSGIAGSTVVGDHVTIAAQVGVTGHIVIGNGATVGGRSGVTGSVKPGVIVAGYPAKDHILEKRILAGLNRLPDLLQRVRHLEQQIQALEAQSDGKTKNDSR